MDELVARVAALEKRADRNDMAAAMSGLIEWMQQVTREDLVRMDDVQAATAGRVAAQEAVIAALIAHAPDWARVDAAVSRRVAELTDDSLRYERPERWLAEYCRGAREVAEAMQAAIRWRTSSGCGALGNVV